MLARLNMHPNLVTSFQLLADERNFRKQQPTLYCKALSQHLLELAKHLRPAILLDIEYFDKFVDLAIYGEYQDTAFREQALFLYRELLADERYSSDKKAYIAAAVHSIHSILEELEYIMKGIEQEPLKYLSKSIRELREESQYGLPEFWLYKTAPKKHPQVFKRRTEIAISAAEFESMAINTMEKQGAKAAKSETVKSETVKSETVKSETVN